MTARQYLDLLKRMKTKKISFNIEESRLKIIDDLANLTKSNRTVILQVIIERGIKPFVKYLDEEWIKLKREGKADSKAVEEVREKLASLKKKWKLK